LPVAVTGCRHKARLKKVQKFFPQGISTHQKLLIFFNPARLCGFLISPTIYPQVIHSFPQPFKP
jgi:hypothetical protein